MFLVPSSGESPDATTLLCPVQCVIHGLFTVGRGGSVRQDAKDTRQTPYRRPTPIESFASSP